MTLRTTILPIGEGLAVPAITTWFVSGEEDAVIYENDIEKKVVMDIAPVLGWNYEVLEADPARQPKPASAM